MATAKSALTYAYQEKLPKLPLPKLESTCEKYLIALEPLQSRYEHEETTAAVHEFLKKDGPDLQDRLYKYASDKTSYIEQFWYDSYLNFENPVVLNLNPIFLLEDDPTPARNNQVTRAASLVVSTLSFVRAVRKEELPPDIIRGKPLCMYQYSRLFGAARVPAENGCHIGQHDNTTHVVVLCKGQFYWFDVLDQNSDLIMTEKDMAVNLEAIVNDAQQIPMHEAAKSALGVLTTETRQVWAGLRDVLTSDEGSNNAECLSTVDSALFILCLDYTEPQTGSMLCGNMMCGTSEITKGVQIGTCTNRWYDKLQIIVCKNGSAGINFEHTGVDGHTVLRMASDVYTDTILRFAKSINGQAPSLWVSTSPDPLKRDPNTFGEVSTIPHKLEWDMIPELSTALRFAETRLADLIHQNELEALEFYAYGKSFITSMGFSPDAFVQMAFQAAYYGLYGRVECTYEPAITKAFLHGRTEAVRSVTAESVSFVQTFWGEKLPHQKVDALRKATAKHTAITKECSKGLGQDRHLYALFCVWQRAVDEEGAEAISSTDTSSNGSPNPKKAASNGAESTTEHPVQEPKLPSIPSPRSPSSRPSIQQMPALFADSGWDRLNSTVLSTSNCGNPSLRQFGFGPSTGNGFGIGYIIKENSISICTSSKHRQTKRFVDTLESYLLEIRRLLRVIRKTSSTTKASGAREEAEERPKMGSRFHTKGKTIELQVVGTERPEDDGEESEDNGLGGYGFFDAGVLLQALNQDADKRPSDKAAGQVRRAVGKKLRLSEY